MSTSRKSASPGVQIGGTDIDAATACIHRFGKYLAQHEQEILFLVSPGWYIGLPARFGRTILVCCVHGKTFLADRGISITARPANPVNIKTGSR